MKWLFPLWIGEKMKHKAAEAAAQAMALKKGPCDGCRFLLLSLHPGSCLDLMTLREMRHEAETGRELCIVGMAADEAETRELLVALTEEAVREMGTPDLKAYFEKLPAEAWTEEAEVSVSRKL